MLRAATVIAVVLALPGLAHAQPPHPTPPSPDPATTTGMPAYRPFILGVDFAAVGIFVIGASEQNKTATYVSIGTYALAAPIIHVAKGRIGTGLASLGMRVGLPLLGGYIGGALHSRSRCVHPDPPFYDTCSDEYDGATALGTILGIGAAMVIDTAYLARGDEPAAAHQPTWSPTVQASQGGFALGAAGTF